MNNTIRIAAGLAAAATSAGLLVAAPPAAAAPVVPETATSCPSVVTVRSQNFTDFPTLVKGDNEFNDNGPAVTVAAKLRKVNGASNDRLYVDVRMRAEETVADSTTAVLSKSFLLYLAPARCDIDMSKLTVGTFDSNGYLNVISDNNPHALPVGDPTSFVQYFRVWDDHPGSDVGSFTRLRVTTKAFTVRFSG
jgi:hypothetical protein